MSGLSDAVHLKAFSHSERRKCLKGAMKTMKQLKNKFQNDVCISETAVTTFLAIGNAGLSCGFSESDIRREIQTGTGKLYVPLLPINRSIDSLAHSNHTAGVDIFLFADEPFALLQSCCTAHVEVIFQALINRIVELGNGQRLPWYPVYLLNLPHCVSSTSSHEMTDTKHPPGLKYLSEFITEEKEAELIRFVEELMASEETKSSGDFLKNRTTLHFGYQFRYGKNDLDLDTPVRPIPGELCGDILQKLVECGCVTRIPDQLTVNIYEPGQGIPPHVDTHSVFEDGICSLSLGGAVVMDFSSGAEDPVLQVLLEPRSLLAMLGESRYAWTHGIVPRATDSLANSSTTGQTWRRLRRISFTFRCAKKTPCECDYREHCDSQRALIQTNPGIPNAHPGDFVAEGCRDPKKPASSLEDEYVYQVYERIAPHFSETRHKAWPQIAKFVAALAPGSVLLDVGCGNGKYLGLNDSLIQIGCDRSSNLISICQARGFQVVVSDILALPFRAGSCDGVICIAVIHHLSSEERRVQAIQEIVRLLRLGGRALIYVWAMEQQWKDQKKSTYLKKTGHKEPSPHLNDGGDPSTSDLPFSAAASSCPLPVHVNRTEFKQQDVLVPWHLKNVPSSADKEKPAEPEKVFHRFYHVFREGELRQCCERLADVRVVLEYYDEGNWCIVLEKTAI
ncbi:Alkylated DNA repair protein alkB-like protein 8 [Hypsibius exemplaris]|uniref:Alkylated DNA repair protein alkB-like protein 8 n=1 Tax=Hypsibius exemplaris TaxID=2072580 RepID=A0A1W0WIX6_HYPEX|nr:Alkylated DNA repair protein alkB-like protein 8 [Hypsibius exemplaris]